MPEVRDHYERRFYSILIGGRKLGGCLIGAGRYTVGPISVTNCIAFFKIVRKLNEKIGAEPDQYKHILKKMPWATFKPLLPLMVREPIKRRHLKRVTAAQMFAALDAFYAANDFDFILGSFKSKSGESSAKRVSLDDAIHYLATRCGAYTHAQIRKLPMQEFLAINDSEKRLQEQQDEPEIRQPLTSEDYALFQSAGIATVH